MTQTLCSLSSVLNCCQRPTWRTQSQIDLVVNSGVVSFRALRDLEQFGIRATLSNQELQSQLEDGEDHDLKPNDSFTLTLPRNTSQNVVVKDLEALLEVDSTTTQWPNAYFLVEEEEPGNSFCYTDDSSLQSAPKRVTRYHQAIDLWKMIKSCADAEKNDALFLFDVKLTKIEPGFRISDLNTPIASKAVATFLDDPDRKKARRDIFRSVLSEFLGQKTDDAFAYLLQNSEQFAQRLDAGWQIYLTDYTPLVMKRQAVVKHLELTEKLEKIVGGMETKSLTIPAAILLAVKEVQFGGHWSTLNTMILVASMLYLIAMIVAYFGQRSTLNLLSTTIDETGVDLVAQGLDKDSKVLKESFANLKSRTNTIGYVSLALVLFSFIPLIAVVYAAFVASPPPRKPADENAAFSTRELA